MGVWPWHLPGSQEKEGGGGVGGYRQSEALEMRNVQCEHLGFFSTALIV